MYGQFDPNAYAQQMQMNPQYNPYVRLQQLEQQQQAQPQQQPRSVDFVGGVDGAKAFQLANNSNAILMDNADPVFYMVQVDSVGMRNIKAFKFEEIEIKQSSAQQIDTSIFATKDDLQAILNEIQSLKGSQVNQTRGGK